MSDYHPDKWLVVKITGPDYPPVHKVFACWYGGYLGSDSWKLNSGSTKTTLIDNHYEFDGSSGSVYFCNVNAYGSNGYGAGVLADIIEKAAKNNITIEVLDETTNFLEINYE